MATDEPVLDEPQLRAICDVLADTSTGLTGGQIGQILAAVGIEEAPAGTAPPGYYRIGPNKRERLFAALANQQKREGRANRVLACVKAALTPVRWIKTPELGDGLRERTNVALAFCGYQVMPDGRMGKVPIARTISEVQERTNALRSKLERRGIHAEVLRFCRPEIVAQNYFHVVLEACKSLAERIREATGLTSDGAALVDAALGGVDSGIPILAFNSLQDDSLKSEQKGLALLLKGVFGAFRNPTAHAPKLVWSLSEADALDVLSIISLLHRRLDLAVCTKRAAGPPAS